MLTWELPARPDDPTPAWLVAAAHLVLMACALELGAMCYWLGRLLHV